MLKPGQLVYWIGLCLYNCHTYTIQEARLISISTHRTITETEDEITETNNTMFHVKFKEDDDRLHSFEELYETFEDAKIAAQKKADKYGGDVSLNIRKYGAK